MGPGERFWVVLGIVGFGLSLRCLVPNYVATEPMKQLCRRLCGVYPELPSMSHLLRLTGWDIANASLGLAVFALILEDSNLRRICDQSMGNYNYVFAFACFLIYLFLFGLAIECRYVLLDTSEKEHNGQGKCGLTLWVLGLVILKYSLWLLAGK